MNIGNLVNMWDKSGSGLVSRAAFKKHVKEMGVEAKHFEVDELFDTLDSDGGGDLDLDEIKKCFKEFVDTHNADQKSLKEKSANVSTARKSVAQRHAKIAFERGREEQSARLDEAAKRTAEVKEIEDVEARRAPKEAKGSAVKAKAEEAAATDERVRVKRASPTP
jgi:hypothetical protein